MNQKTELNIFQRIFTENWNEQFIFDTINSNILTYKNFFELVITIKNNLEEKNIKDGDYICCILKNSIELIALFFASALLKTTLICIDPSRGSDEILKMAKIQQSKFYFVDEKNQNFGISEAELFSNIFQKNNNLDIKLSDLKLFDSIDFERLFTITFTSGSTGMPKGVMHNLNNYLKSSLIFNKRFNFSKKNIFYHNLPLSYIGGILNLLFLPFFSESKIVLDEQFNITKIATFWENPIRYSVNTFWFTPTELSLLLKLDRGSSGIEYCKNNNIIGLVGTASLREEIKTDFEKKYPIKLFESYCLSETFFVTTNYPQNDLVNHTGPLLDDVQISFTNDNEILLNTPSMFLGYVGLPNDKFFDNNGFYLSGDLGKFNNDFLQILGRKKDLIIKGGMNLSPKRIEDFVIDLKTFDELTILGIEDYYMGEKIVCFYTSEKSHLSEEIKSLNNKIIQKLGIYFKIDEFIKLNALPKTPSGKINKPGLKQKYKEFKEK